MKMKVIILLGIIVILLSSCVPVLSYSVTPYAGSLDRCLDIQGTYMELYKEKLYKEGGGFGELSDFLPRRFDRESNKEGFRYFYRGEKKLNLIDTWITFRFLDSQRLEATVFNIEGQSFTMVFNMQERDQESNWRKEEKFSCDASSWQKSFTDFSMGEGGRSKSRRFMEITRYSSGVLKMEDKRDRWSGYFGLYMKLSDPLIAGEMVSYFRKVDLTVDDIRAMNDKAKRAIYDQLATNPPPESP
ncbi:MAG: hypothetical protein FWF41_07175 [Betaproteobacteria bacterium]|nr:hypothetical protein [Betaproteobacteria bacterium]